MSVAAAAQSMATMSVSALSHDEVMSKFKVILKEVRPTHFYKKEAILALLSKYSVAELELIYQDFCELREQTFARATKGCLDYVVTAGGPASGKSTILEQFLESRKLPGQSELGPIRAYIDPDRSCLQKMQRTYLTDLSSHSRTPQQAYEHWREASNFLSNVYLAIALDQGYAIAHGSTMATPYAKNALDAIRTQYGYHTTVIHVTCNEDIRQASETARQTSGIVQCMPEDFKAKQGMFFNLLSDYITHSDTVYFCYRQTFDTSVWVARLAIQEEEENLRIFDQSAFDALQRIHDSVKGEEFWEGALFAHLMPATKLMASIAEGDESDASS